MNNKGQTRGREQAWFAILLAWTGGGVDAIGFLTLLHLFTAHMSGNSAAAGAYAGQGNWQEAARRAFPIPVFVTGVFFGAILVEIGLRRKARSPFTIVFALEALLLLAFLLGGRHFSQGTGLSRPAGPAFYGLAALPALAMGLQNATLRRVGETGVRTTYITGMLTRFAETGAACALWLRDRTRGRGLRRLCLALRLSPRRRPVRRLSLFGGIWVGYIVGALLAARAETWWHWSSLWLPLCGLAGLLVWDLRRPLAAVPVAAYERGL